MTENNTITKTKSAAMSLTNSRKLFSRLRKTDKAGAGLYLFCNFVALLLITAYSIMMFSPTVLGVLPRGGDSRKQMIAIFVLALFGCIIFTIYAAGLFFRKKSGQLGTLMALGASRKWLAPNLYRETVLFSAISSLLGILAGFPFVRLIWGAFRLLVTDSAEMTLKLDYRCLWISAAFFLLVVAFSCRMAHHYLMRTNIMEVIHEEHKNEPVRQLGRWCGPVGIVLVFAGAILGYLAPSIYTALFQAYSPAWLNVLFAPVFVGLYLIMLHTVIHGWRSHRKHPYKNIIARSMMKFQGKQTVNNLLVSTVLIAGASFALFYTPMMSVSRLISFSNRPFSYFFLTPQTNPLAEEGKLAALAEKNGLSVADYQEYSGLVLGMDGYTEVETQGDHFDVVYFSLLTEGRFLSASDYAALTGSPLAVESGTYYVISNSSETNLIWTNPEATLLTNMVTRSSLPVAFAGYTHYELLAGMTPFYVISDEDYEVLSTGLTSEWQETLTLFNIEGEDSYEAANGLYQDFLASFEGSCALPRYYDRVWKIAKNEQGEVYWGDTDQMTKLDYEHPDSTQFRNYWLYMPGMIILDKTDFVRTYAVFLMMFLFISIICILAAIVICYARCMTIVMNNRYVFDDLRKLGASPSFLAREIKNEAENVFRVPTFVGMGIMFFLYGMLMYGNDGVLTFAELLGLGACLGFLLFLGLIIYLVYRHTLNVMRKQLNVEES